MNEQVLSKLKPTLKNYSLHSELDRHSLSLPLARGAWHVFYRRFELVFGLVEIVLWRSLCSALWLEFTCVLGGLILHFGLFWLLALCYGKTQTVFWLPGAGLIMFRLLVFFQNALFFKTAEVR